LNQNQEHQDDSMVMIETNLDDMSGEWMGYVMDRLFETGAKDAFYTPIYMKKNRPAQKLSVLAKEQDLPTILDFLFRETTTLGVRYYPVTCHRLERIFFKVKLALGDVSVKIGKRNGEVVQVAPEYEECATLARNNGIPLKQVFNQVQQAFWEQYPEWGIHKKA